MALQMAMTPNSLVGLTARLLGLPVSTVRNVDRQLMEAGLRTKKGRGRGSALMSPSDAATLLIALAASDQLSSVQACVSQTRSLPIFRSPDRGLRTVTHEDDFNALVALIGSKQDNLVTFGSAIDAVMEFLARNPNHQNTFEFNVDSVGGSPLTAELFVAREDVEDRRTIIFRDRGSAKIYLSGSLRVVRFVSGGVMARIAAEIGYQH
jgi:hypothetical protein